MGNSGTVFSLLCWGCLATTLCASQLPTGNSGDVLTGLLHASPYLELSGYFHVDSSKLRVPGMVSVNTTLTAAPGEIALLDLAVSTSKAPLYVLPDVTLTVEQLKIAGASQVMSEQGTGDYTVWFPFFALLPQGVLELRDLTVYLNPTVSNMVSPTHLASPGEAIGAEDPQADCCRSRVLPIRRYRVWWRLG